MIAPDPARIAAVRAALSGRIVRTPLIPLDAEGDIWLKPEMLQPHGSFKLRAALGAMAGIEGANPLITASAGNFGQGLAGAAQVAGRALTVAVPDTAAATKRAAMAALGARLIEMPFEAWWEVFCSRQLAGHQGHFVHPVADAGVVAGNASIGCEIAEDLPDVASVIVPFGGGGLAVGVALGLRAMGSAAQVVVVESEASNQVAAALCVGHPVPAERRPSFIDGMGGRGVLPEMWPLVQKHVASVVQVTVGAVEDAVAHAFRTHRLIAEGAGAAALAAAMQSAEVPRPTVAVLSGGNLDPAQLCRILRR
jgi:threonine dehydratase